MKLASIEIIKNLVAHPNADTLDIAEILGYKAIVKRGLFSVGDKIVFIQPDTVLPDEQWAQMYKAKSNRVKAIRLRNAWSEGVVEKLDTLNLKDVEVGQEVAEIIGVTKYEPPLPKDLSAKGLLPYGIPKTDEERFQNIDDLPFGEKVDISHKIDGKSSSFYFFNGAIGVCSRSLELKIDSENEFTQTARNLKIFEKIIDYCSKHKLNTAFRGELYGKGIQAFSSNPHAKKPLGFALFNVFDIDNRAYFCKDSEHYYENVGKELNLEIAPIIEKDVILTPELIKKYSEDLTQLNGELFEGVVVKHKRGSFKIINKYYDSKK